jgi:hypothetical protein
MVANRSDVAALVSQPFFWSENAFAKSQTLLMGGFNEDFEDSIDVAYVSPDS